MEGGTGPSFAGRVNATYYTMASNTSAVYAILMSYPAPDRTGKCSVTLTKVTTTKTTTISLLGLLPGADVLEWHVSGNSGGATVDLPCQPPTNVSSAWVIKLTGLKI